MSFLLNLISVPLGYAIFFIHHIIQNYGWSIVVFTIIFKIILVPLMIKQQKAAAKMSAFKPLIDEINFKFKNNPRKKSEELQNFYSKIKINPAAGCLPSLLPIFILFGMMDVIDKPLTHILHLNSDVIASAESIFNNSLNSLANSSNRNIQLHLVNDIINNPLRYSSLGDGFINSVQSINLNFLTFNLADFVDLMSMSIIFPILATILSILQSVVMVKLDNTNMLMQSGGVMKFIIFVTPILNFFIALNWPIGVSVYSITNYFFQIIQSLVIKRFVNFKKIVDQATEELKLMKGKKKSLKESNKNSNNISNNERLRLARKMLDDKFED